MGFAVVIEPAEEGGFVAHVPSVRGCWSNGDSLEETLRNIREAIEAYLEPEELEKADSVELGVDKKFY
ncbi:MAG: type II toxin-antitoxin system HicB family antitoxin [Candidatus Hydrothermarchaeota archaeon]|nr:MAG: type II toxin-antitoxin system HicB family antitoxin [Candidatus Hydrothermarchaeota archaeon]